MNYKIGDVVRLKSERHPMTVSELRSQFVECLWQDREGRLQRSMFHVETLALEDQDGDRPRKFL